MFHHYSFGSAVVIEDQLPLNSASPLLQRLRSELTHGHTRNGGSFTPQARADIVHDIWAAIFEVETEDMQIFDVEDPLAVPGTRCPTLAQSVVKDDDGWPRPWSLSGNQRRGEQVRRKQGRSSKVVPKGRICGKVLKRGQRYYNCK